MQNNFNRTANVKSLELKAISKFQQLVKDAQSSGDPVLVEKLFTACRSLLRRLAEINIKNQNNNLEKEELKTIADDKDVNQTN